MSFDIAKKLYYVSLKTKTNDLDKKHSQIVSGAKELKFSQILKNFRNWELQSDSGIPFQVNFYNFKSFGVLRYLKFLASKMFKFLKYGCDEVDYFFDDISIIKLLGGFDILEKCPVHMTPGKNLAYFFNKKISGNVRWLRYIYFVSVIRNFFKDKKEPELILDLGSFYGGFQYVMKKIFPNCAQILVDFPHQLSRSAIFLKRSFPQSSIFAIYDDKTFDLFFDLDKETKFEFILLSTDFYEKFSNKFTENNQRIDLFTNFYSLGEMPNKYFKSYLKSNILKNSNYIYFCNRYDSSPFYEKTFDESFSILDYLLNDFKVKLNRSSGIHSYMMPIRGLFGIKKQRPISSGYFELIQQNNKLNNN